MSGDPGGLYQQLILDHNRSPRNRGRLADATRHAEGYNPLCGDRIALDLRLEGDVVAAVAFEGAGCAISTASASMMTQAIKGRPVAEVEALFDRFHGMVAGSSHPAPAGDPAVDKLEALAGVRQYPARVKCATLAWHTLMAALDARAEVVSTE